MSCDKNKSFQVANLFNELKTDGEKRIARLNLGVKDSDSLTWGNIGGNIYDQEDLVYFVEMLKMLASQTGTVAIFRLNNNEINRNTQNIPYGWQDNIPDTTPQDELWMSQAVKQGGIYKVNSDGTVWSGPIKINYSNVVDDAQQLEIDELRSRLNASIQNQQYIDNLVNSMNQVTVNEDGSISVVGRDGQTSVWQHQDLGNYLLLGNIYGTPEQNETSYFVINKTGLLQAHNAVVHGTIYATDGWFSGQLRAATGSFTGEITATSGRIGGWQIVDGVLKPENVPTTALIGKIQASQVEFGSTLTDLRVLIQNDYDNKFDEIRTDLQQNVNLINTKFQLTNSLIQSSVQEIKEIQNTQNSKIDGVKDDLTQEKNNRIAQYQLLESKIRQSSDQLSLGVQESLLAYSNKLKDYITTQQLESSLTLLSNQIAAKVSQTEYDANNNLILDKFAELAITSEQIQSIVTNKVTEATSNLTQTTNSLQAQITENDNLLSQLGITSDGIIMKGNTLAYYATGNITDPVFACNSDGSGKIAKGNIWWDANGNVTLSGNIVISWDDITDKPNIDPDGSVKIPAISNIAPIYYKGQTAPSKPTKNTVISNESNPTNLWTTKIPTVNEKNQHLYKSNKITYVKSINDEGDTFTYTDVEQDEAMETAQRAKEQLSSLFEEVDNGTTITRDYIYTGSFGAQYAYVMNIQSATTNPKWKLSVDGSGFLASNNIAWDTNGNLQVKAKITATSGTIGGLTIYDSFLTTASVGQTSNYLEVYSGNIDGYALLYQFDNNNQFLVQGATYNNGIKNQNGAFGLYKDAGANSLWYNVFYEDGSGSLASDKIIWNADGYGTLAGKINWDNSNLSFTNGLDYDMALDSSGLVITKYEDNSTQNNNIVLPGGHTIHVNKDYSRWSVSLQEKPYANLTDEALTLNSGNVLGYKSILSNSLLTFTGPYMGFSSNVSINGFDYNNTQAGTLISTSLNNTLSFTKTVEERQLDFNTGNSNLITTVTTISIGRNGINRTVTVNDESTENTLVTWDQFFNKFTN